MVHLFWHNALATGYKGTSSCVAMLLGAWSICYQLGSGSRWCTSTLLISSESRIVMTSSSKTFTQTFFGVCYNDDSKYGLFMTKVTGVRLGKEIMWQQLIPTQWSYDVEPLLFLGYLNMNRNGINAGRIYSLTGQKNAMAFSTLAYCRMTLANCFLNYPQA